MRGSAQRGGQIRRYSGWLIPLCVVLVLLGLSTVVLLYYLRPLLLPAGQPLTMPTPVALSVGGVRLRIPANYLEDTAARHGGMRQSVTLFALLPGFTGYSGSAAAAFASNAPDSPVLHIQLHGGAGALSTRKRLARLYMPYIVDPKGHPAAFGLTRYDFRPESGYDGDELYAASGPGGPLLLLCERPAQDVPSPNCFIIDRPEPGGINLTCRFKRSQLSQWRRIEAGVDRLVNHFRTG